MFDPGSGLVVLASIQVLQALKFIQFSGPSLEKEGKVVNTVLGMEGNTVDLEQHGFELLGPLIHGFSPNNYCRCIFLTIFLVTFSFLLLPLR